MNKIGLALLWCFAIIVWVLVLLISALTFILPLVGIAAIWFPQLGMVLPYFLLGLACYILQLCGVAIFPEEVCYSEKSFFKRTCCIYLAYVIFIRDRHLWIN